ncbi:MAG: phosphoenolpyruvate carboxykinase (GTP) [Candidatus Improbicoccus pseudotrichonymphae]|uniref:Phosphoenolpyruvate carboxykinase [GTP] n=1 Tax=Candidatus Improbicoccus pseudotrichonymphae TaxID=3033792 RepID=A0AA48I3E7_9FIRM|nr:MAG: phosphoenolpyruvate carboxykinase (GTP) [Candidatus Improbicoccus pseudotrichonymphae]
MNILKNKSVASWVNKIKEIFDPSEVIWLNGDVKQIENLKENAVKGGILFRLNEGIMPNCFLHRSSINDVARSESRTFVCCDKHEDAGPTNNWQKPHEAFEKLINISKNSYRNRKMYVIPFAMGPPGSPLCKLGIQVTDSVYVAIMMTIMTRLNSQVIKKFESLEETMCNDLLETTSWTRCLHASCDNDPENRYICHFPQSNFIFSINSNYGGNALLGKKCLALRLASVSANKEGWLAEHMAIVGIKRPGKEIKYMCACFPSGCGKTDFAMMKLPKSYTERGYEVWCVGDDIAWLKIDSNGRLRAINAENGFFGACSGINKDTNISLAIKKNTIFTNVMHNLADNTVWWDGLSKDVPENSLNWKGEHWEKQLETNQKNARFAVSAKNYPYLSKEFDNPEGVVIDAIIFGGKRKNLMPLVAESKDWEHGVFMASVLSTEITSAVDSNVGKTRRDPFSMLSFCGYNMADYFKHWLNVGKKLVNAPKIFHVNWFMQDEKDEIIWPGFGENIRVVDWILDRIENNIDCKDSLIGFLPYEKDINTKGMNLNEKHLNKLLFFDEELWDKEKKEIKSFYDKLNVGIFGKYIK